MHIFRLYSRLSVFSLIAPAFASIIVQRPIEEQLPLVARVNQTYQWSISRDTFISTRNSTLVHTALDLPTWLSFDNTTLSFSGTPTTVDVGNFDIQVRAEDPNSSDSEYNKFILCVSTNSPPQVQHTVQEQFLLPNPSLSSVFLVAGHSALQSSVPALRIPPKWSFSIGFRYDTFTLDSDGTIFYAASQADNSPLPDWIEFNSHSLTFNGYTPSRSRTLSLALHASDHQGYSASSLPFNIFVAEHEMYLATSSLPTINVTADVPFTVSLNSPADFSGVLLDGNPLQPSNITTVEVDISYYGDWLRYDTHTRTLSGKPPAALGGNIAAEPVLPVTLMTWVNQTIETNVTLAVVPSYFSVAMLQPILAESGRNVSFSLSQFFSNATPNEKDDVSLSATFEPEDSASFLSFDSSTSTLSGEIPSNPPDYQHITISFTAYSHITHSTSHTVLPISLTSTDFADSNKKISSGELTLIARRHLLLGLEIAFGIIGGLVLLGLLLAGFRRCAKVRDTALEGEEGAQAWTEEEKKWYGIGIELGGKAYGGQDLSGEYGYNHSRIAIPPHKKYGGIGVGSNYLVSSMSPGSLPQSPGVMRKGDFIGKIKVAARHVSDTVRVVSDTARRAVNRNNSRSRLMVSEPVTIVGREPSQPLDHSSTSEHNPDASGDLESSHYAPSGMTSLADSPSSSTGGKSIPRRRSDFAPPPGKSPLGSTYVAMSNTQARFHSVESLASTLSTNESRHAEEAVVQKAKRARSVRSARSASGFYQTFSASHLKVSEVALRPRLVPFTSANKVPTPKLSSPQPTPDIQSANIRVTSQVARVFKTGSPIPPISYSQEGEDFSAGIEHIYALDDRLRSEASQNDTPSASFSISESVKIDEEFDVTTLGTMLRVLARTAEPFRFRVPLSRSTSDTCSLDIRLISGKSLPQFISVSGGTTGGTKQKRFIELSGLAEKVNIGEWNIGAYKDKDGGECVGRVILEIIERS